jgi:feruloyl esterase
MKSDVSKCAGLATLLSLIAAVVATGQDARGAAPATEETAQKCAALAQLDLQTTAGGPGLVTSARLVDVPAGGLEAGRFFLAGLGGRAALGRSPIKRYCEVAGYVAPQNKFVLRLPLPADWNRKFLFSACAGFCGGVMETACNPGLARGYAAVTSNGGHDGVFGFDGIWAANAPNLQEDFGWRGNHVVTLVAKAATARYYGQPIEHSYMVGCSKGGHGVLMEAQRFPEDYDGLLPVAPVYDITGRTIAGAWFAQAVSDGAGGSVLDAAAAEAIHASVLKLCGAQAGVDEGMVTDPAACRWQPEMVACAPASTSPGCLSAAQVTAVKRLMSPVTNSKGEVVYAYPYIPGTETEWAPWNFAGPRPASAVPQFFNYKLAHQFGSYMADERPRHGVDPLAFDFDKDPATYERARKIYDATSHDLHAFKARGGKMVMWHGLADGGIMATSSIGYYDAVVKRMGGRKQTEDFFRMFLVPGVHHCQGGPGPSEFDALTLLENWVEKGQAPDVLMTQRSSDGVVERTRPVYPYPIQARYSGKGDPKQSSSFVPVDPRR